MDNGWQSSANAWITDMGEHGDFSRKHILDPVMLPHALAPAPKRVLDVGCGEGRFCRILKQNGIPDVTGLDPTATLIEAARTRDPQGNYLQASAEQIPFADSSFDLVISYLTLIDIPDFKAAIAEMARVLAQGGRLLIANLTSFNTAGAESGWIKDDGGKRLYYPIDNYMDERAIWIEYRGIRVVNHHRPLSAYMKALLDAGLVMTFFDEPLPDSAAIQPGNLRNYRRSPWFLVMEWLK